jgi:hypothetical protein
LETTVAGDYQFRVEQAGAILNLHGVIDENANLDFFAKLKGAVQVSLKNVRRINSFGVRQWIEAIRHVPAGVRLQFLDCPPPVVDQINMVAGFLGKGEVVSFYAPMICPSCSTETDALFDVTACRAAGNHLPKFPCPKCGSSMEVDDLEEQYLLFLRAK